MKKFLSGSIILVVGTLIMSALNYLYNIFINRALTPADFGTFTALLGTLAILSVPVGTIQTVTTRYAADYTAEQDINSLKALLLGMSRRLAPVGLIIFLVFVLIPRPIANFLSGDSNGSLVLPIMIIGLAFLFQLLLPVNRGILQGRQQFWALAVNFILDSSFRILLGLLFLIPLTNHHLGQAIVGIFSQSLKIEHPWVVPAAIGAIVTGTFTAYLLSFWPLKDISRAKTKPVKLDKESISKYIWPTFFMFVFLALLFNVDIILVKKFSAAGTSLTPENAGEYATLSTLAKLIFYITGPIVTVMFPMIAERVKRGVRHYMLLLSTLGAVLFSSVVVLGIFAAAPRAIVGFLTPDYVKVAEFLVPMTVIFLVYGLINVMTNYFLSLKEFNFLIPLGLMAIVEIVLISLFHSTMVQVIQMVIISQTILLALLLWLYLTMKREQLIQLIGLNNAE